MEFTGIQKAIMECPNVHMFCERNSGITVATIAGAAKFIQENKNGKALIIRAGTMHIKDEVQGVLNQMGYSGIEIDNKFYDRDMKLYHDNNNSIAIISIFDKKVICQRGQHFDRIWIDGFYSCRIDDVSIQWLKAISPYTCFIDQRDDSTIPVNLYPETKR